MIKAFETGMATGIGSLPYSEPDSAIKLIKKTIPDMPHWPQLPARGAMEGFCYQFCNVLLEAGLVSDTNGKLRYAAGDELQLALARFYEVYLAAEADDDYDAFAFADHSAAGFSELMNCKQQFDLCKGQTSGPLTVGFAITNDDMRSAWYHDDVRDAIVKALSGNARWQVRMLSRIGKQPVMFVDEPGLYVYGQSTYVAVSRIDIERAVGEILQAARQEGALTGVHVCAGCDWSIATGLPIDVLSFDAAGYLQSLLPYGSAIESFLRRGGWLAWGIIPTSSEADDLSVDDVKERLDEGIDTLVRRGVSEDLLRSQLIVTPSCGTGTLSVTTAERIYELTGELSSLIRNQGAAL